jgi:hypothetical protein
LRPNHGRSGDGERGERCETQEISSLHHQILPVRRGRPTSVDPVSET